MDATRDETIEKSQRAWLMPVVIALAVVAAYANTFRSPFVFDDHNAIVLNPHVRSLWPVWQAMDAPYESSTSGRPVVSLTLAMNFAISGFETYSWHVWNIEVHVANALLVFGIGWRTFFRFGSGRSAKPQAAALALLWALHPVCSESVTYILQRTESMMAMFLLGSLYCFVRSVDSSNPKRWRVGAIVCCALSMGCKEVGVVTPMLIWIYDRTFVSGTFGGAIRSKRGFYVALACTWVVLPIVLMNASIKTHLGAHGFERMGPWLSLKTQASVIVYYIRLCFWPVGLNIDYYDWLVAEKLSSVLWQGCVVVGLMIGTIVAMVKKPWLGFLGAWFFIILSPTSSFLPQSSEIAAERRMYLPLLAVVTIFVIATTKMLPRRGAVIVGIILAVVLGVGTFVRNAAYASEVKIWADAVAKRPGNSRGWFNLGQAMARVNNRAGAIAAYEHALRLEPNRHDARFKLGVSLAADKNFDAAIEQFDLAAYLKPDAPEIYFQRGAAHAASGQYDQAEADFRKAIELKPDYAEAMQLLDAVHRIRARGR